MAHSSRPTFQCSNCGVTLPIPEGKKVVICEYCGTHTALPPELWHVPEPAAPSVGHVPPTFRPDLPPPILSPAPVQPRKAASAVVVLLGVLIAGAVASVVFFISARSEDPGFPGAEAHPVHSTIGKVVSADDVVPVWASVDSLKTATNFDRSVRAGWAGGNARLGGIRFHKVPQTGILDLDGEDGSMMTMTFYDSSKLGDVIPGESSIKKAQLTVNVQNGYIGIAESDLNTAWLDDLEFVQSIPRCGLTELWAKAIEYGYPEKGFAMISYPDVPSGLEKKGMDFALSFVRKDGDRLKKKLEAMEWDTTRFHYWSIHISNFDASKLPTYFSADDCEAIDEEQIQKQLIEELRAK